MGHENGKIAAASEPWDVQRFYGGAVLSGLRFFQGVVCDQSIGRVNEVVSTILRVIMGRRYVQIISKFFARLVFLIVHLELLERAAIMTCLSDGKMGAHSTLEKTIHHQSAYRLP